MIQLYLLDHRHDEKTNHSLDYVSDSSPLEAYYRVEKHPCQHKSLIEVLQSARKLGADSDDLLVAHYRGAKFEKLSYEEFKEFPRAIVVSGDFISLDQYTAENRIAFLPKGLFRQYWQAILYSYAQTPLEDRNLQSAIHHAVCATTHADVNEEGPKTLLSLTRNMSIQPLLPGSSILLIDDNASKWKEPLRRLLLGDDSKEECIDNHEYCVGGEKSTLFYSDGMSLVSLDHSQPIQLTQLFSAIAENTEVAFVDYRLLREEELYPEKYFADAVSGARLIRVLQEKHPTLPIVAFTASQKARTLGLLYQYSIIAYFQKPGQFPSVHNEQDILYLKKAIGTIKEYFWLRALSEAVDTYKRDTEPEAQVDNKKRLCDALLGTVEILVLQRNAEIALLKKPRLRAEAHFRLSSAYEHLDLRSKRPHLNMNREKTTSVVLAEESSELCTTFRNLCAHGNVNILCSNEYHIICHALTLIIATSSRCPKLCTHNWLRFKALSETSDWHAIRNEFRQLCESDSGLLNRLRMTVKSSGSEQLYKDNLRICMETYRDDSSIVSGIDNAIHNYVNDPLLLVSSDEIAPYSILALSALERTSDSRVILAAYLRYLSIIQLVKPYAWEYIVKLLTYAAEDVLLRVKNEC